MDLRALIESLQRLYLNPSVGPTTEVCVEMETEHHHHHHYKDGDDDEPDHEVSVGHDAVPLAAVAIDNNGRRAVVLSSLPRRDAIAR